MADENDINIGVEVDVAANNASGKLTNELAKIENVTKAHHSRLETEEVRHQAALASIRRSATRFGPPPGATQTTSATNNPAAAFVGMSATAGQVRYSTVQSRQTQADAYAARALQSESATQNALKNADEKLYQMRLNGAQQRQATSARTNAAVNVLDARTDAAKLKGVTDAANSQLRTSSSINQAQQRTGAAIAINASRAANTMQNQTATANAQQVKIAAQGAAATATSNAQINRLNTQATNNTAATQALVNQRNQNAALAQARAAALATRQANQAAGPSDFRVALFNSTVQAVNQTLGTLQQWAIRLGSIGFKGLVAEGALLFGTIVKITSEFIKVNEEFSNFELTMGSIFKSATDAQNIRKELAGYTAQSPLPFEGLAELVKSLAINPALRSQTIQQVRSGTSVDDPNSFIGKNIHLVEQMLAFRPDKTVADAIYSLREAMAGQFRSLTRRFDISPSSLSALSGVSQSDMKNDPRKALEGIQKAFAQIIDPSAVQQMAQQPSKLFRNLLEQIVVIPLMTLGKDTRLQQTGQSLYDSVLAPFRSALRGSSDFFSPQKDNNGKATQSQFQPYADQMGERVFSIFSKVVTFFSQSLDRTLNSFGLGGQARPNESIYERISRLIVVGLEAIDRNVIPAMHRIRDLLVNFGTLLQGLVNTVAKLLSGPVGGFVAKNPVTSLVAAAAARPVLGGVFKTLGEVKVPTNSFFGLAGSAAGSAATGAAGTAGLAATVTSVGAMVALPLVVALIAGGAMAAIYAWAKSQRNAEKADVSDLRDVLRSTADSSDPNAASPNKIMDTLRLYQENLAYEKSHPDLVKNDPSYKNEPGYSGNLLKELTGYGLNPNSSVLNTTFGPSAIDSSPLQNTKRFSNWIFGSKFQDEGNLSPEAQDILKVARNQQTYFDSPAKVNARNANFLADQNTRGNAFSGQLSRTVDFEGKTPGIGSMQSMFADLDSLKPYVGGEEGGGAKGDLDSQLEKKLHPLAAAEEQAKLAVSTREKLQQIMATFPDKIEAAHADYATLAQKAQATLDSYIAHPTDKVPMQDGVTRAYKDALEFQKRIVALYTAGTAPRSEAEVRDIYLTLAKAKATLDSNVETGFSEAQDQWEKLIEMGRNQAGGGDSAIFKRNLEDVRQSQITRGIMPADQVNLYADAVQDAVVQKGTNSVKGNIDQAKYNDLAKKIYEALFQGATKMTETMTQQLNQAVDGMNTKLPNAGVTGITGIGAPSTGMTQTNSTVFGRNWGGGIDTNDEGHFIAQYGTTEGMYRAHHGAYTDPSTNSPYDLTQATGVALPNKVDGKNPGFVFVKNPANNQYTIVPVIDYGPSSDQVKAGFGLDATPNVLRSIGATPGSSVQYQHFGTMAEAQAFAQQQQKYGGFERTVNPLSAPGQANQLLQDKASQDASQARYQTAQQDQNYAYQQLDKMVAFDGALLDKAGNTGRGSQEGQVAMKQFQNDLDGVNRNFGGAFKGLDTDVSSLYTNVKKMGVSGLDTTLAKLQMSQKMTNELADKIEALSNGIDPNSSQQARDQKLRLDQMVETLRMRAAGAGDSFNQQKLSNDPLGSFAQGFGATAQKPANYFSDLRSAGAEAASGLTNSFSGFFASFADGTKTMGQRFADFGKSVLDTFAKIAAQKGSEALVNAIFGIGKSLVGIGSAGYSDYGGNISNYGDTQAINIEGHATGGAIFGPGTATSDSIPARLSAGEHVWTATEVKGAGGHRAVEKMRAKARGYHNGGTVYPFGYHGYFNGYASGGPVYAPTGEGSNPASPSDFTSYAGGSGSSHGGDVYIDIPIKMSGGNSNGKSQSRAAYEQRKIAEGYRSAVLAEMRRQKRVGGIFKTY